MFHGFSKPQNKFIRDMVDEIQATGDTILDCGRKFITRMNQRDIWSWKATKSSEWLAGQCVMRHKAVVKFDSHGKETSQLIEFVAMPVRNPRILNIAIGVADQANI